MRTDDEKKFDARLGMLLDFADVVKMLVAEHYQLLGVQEDRDYWRKQYHELLDSSIKSSEQMIGSMMKAMVENDIVVTPRKPAGKEVGDAVGSVSEAGLEELVRDPRPADDDRPQDVR